MSRDDYDDEEPRPHRRRRSYDEEDDYEAPRRRRGSGAASGSVTSVGVITIILGSLMLLCGLCVSGAGLVAGAGAAGARGGPPGFPGLMQMTAGLIVVFALLILIFGGLYLAGGIGVIQRRNWGRIMTLVMAGFSGVFGILTIIGTISNLMQPAPPPGFGPPGFQQGFQSGRVMGILINVVMIFVWFTHCIMSYVVLLNSRNASEFE